jgi:DNA-binding GntR family transcriptional regulator
MIYQEYLMPLTPVSNPVSLEKLAYDAIKAAILTFQLRPGDSLVEADLGRQLGISKTPVRDALSRLEKEGLVVKVLYKGATVTELNHQDVVEIFQIRAALEGLAARLAAANLSEADLRKATELEEGHLRAAMNNEISQGSALNREFHELIQRAADNAHLTLILSNLDDHLQRYRTLSNVQQGRLRKSVQEHAAVLTALTNRDAGQAEAHMKEHLLSVLQDLQQQDFNELVEMAHDQAAHKSAYGLE